MAADDDWVGWKRGNSSVQLTFYFLQRQNFSSIRFYTSNLFTRHIDQFQSIRIESCDGKGSSSIDQLVPPDTDDSNARWIEIFIEEGKSLISDCLDVHLRFSNRSEWILISEVEFNSTVALDLPTSINRPASTYYQYGFYLLTSSLLVLVVVLIFFYFKSIPNADPPSKLCK